MKRVGLGIAMAAWIVLPPRGLANGVIDLSADDTNDTLQFLFPNWKNAHAADFSLTECDATCGCVTGDITSLTIWNYGTASGGPVGDVTAVYFNLDCGGTNVWETMTWAGPWTVAGTPYPAWTWTGDIPWGSKSPGDCALYPNLGVNVDVGACPAEGKTVIMGIGYDDLSSTTYPGGLWDDCGYNAPDYPEAIRVGVPKTIVYAQKSADRQSAAPGDTIAYTIYYGEPGASISNFVITDSLPASTHYVVGSGVPAPDVGWDPDPGPPLRLRWTLPGVASTGGGPTNAVSFKVSVDWGNGESFEPGSGDVAAAEGSRIGNVAAVDFQGSGCVPTSHLSNATDTSVRRYMMWQVADQDLLFAPRVGYPDDEITYSTFIRNMSATKTWWNVQVWDTVPAVLDVWGAANYGFDDPCSGWTMTPSGCAAASPSALLGGGNTIMQWSIGNMPPGYTIELRWKARVSPSGVVPNMTATNLVSLLARGAPRQIGGSGSALASRNFTHQAVIALRTTYYSYVGQAGSNGGAGLRISFYPLNKATTFELRKFYDGTKAPGFAGSGGKSPSIVAFQGTCNGGFVDGGNPGCGIERAPAQYFWLASTPDTPNVALYKLTSNAPLIWLVQPEIDGGGDAATYVASASLSYSGFTMYSYRRASNGSSAAGWGESWVVVNTSVDATGAFDPNRTTTAHVFSWDPVALVWNYVSSMDIDKNSLWMPFAGCTVADQNHYKIISSDAKLVVYQTYGTIGTPNINFSNEAVAISPTAQDGALVSKAAPADATFYPFTHYQQPILNMGVGTVGSAATAASYQVDRYAPSDPTLASVGIPPTLCGASGTWVLLGMRTAAPTLGVPAGTTDNAHWFSGGFPDKLTVGSLSYAYGYKVDLALGGPVSVYNGGALWRDWSGGIVLSAIDGKPAGKEFWLHIAQDADVYAAIVCGPTQGMVINAKSNDGYDASYTTDGPDQCVMFMALTHPAPPLHRNFIFSLLPGGAQADVMVDVHNSAYREKFFVAPFVSTGVHYDIIAPPVVFTGQPFWITVVVVLGNGNTQTTYTGTTSFTSTDPLARIESQPMDAYNYAWLLANSGVKMFFNVTLNLLGLQSILGTDLLDGSITGITAVQVVGADVKLTKQPPLQVSASGDTVQFKICWSNYSTATASTFTITDAVPDGTVYVPDTPSNHLCGATKGFGAATVAYSTTTNTPAAYATLTGPATTAVQFLRWTIPTAGVATTGCVCFKVSVD